MLGLNSIFKSAFARMAFDAFMRAKEHELKPNNKIVHGKRSHAKGRTWNAVGTRVTANSDCDMFRTSSTKVLHNGKEIEKTRDVKFQVPGTHIVLRAEPIPAFRSEQGEREKSRRLRQLRRKESRKRIAVKQLLHGARYGATFGLD